MMPPESLVPLREVIGHCADSLDSRTTRRGTAVLFYSPARDAVEVMYRKGLPPELGAAFSGEGGKELLSWARRSTRTHLLRLQGLAKRVPELADLLEGAELGGIALLPLPGGDSVLGYLVVGLPPELSRSPRDHSLDLRPWRELKGTLGRMRLEVNAALLRFFLSRGQDEPEAEAEALLVLDSEERILFSHGVSRLFPSWGRGEAAGESLRALPSGRTLASVESRDAPGMTWTKRSVTEGGRQRSLDVAATSLRPGENGACCWKMILVRRGGETSSTRLEKGVLLMELALRLGHLTEKPDVGGGNGRKGSEPSPAERTETGDLASLARSALAAAQERTRDEAVDLTGLFRDILERMEPELRDDRVRVLPILSEDLPLVRGQKRALETALWTLLRRSWTSLLPRGGTITVRTWEEEGSVWCTIADDGPGIEDSPIREMLSLEPLLPPGESQNLPESDIALARSLVGTGGGSFHVESRPRLWTCYSVVFPAEATVAEREEAEGLPPAVEVRRNGDGELGVLVVDDNEMVRTVLKKYLERKGFTVREAVDGGAALDLLREEDFDRVMVDIDMPGTTGVEFYRKLDSVAPFMRDRTIFMTGGFQEAETEEFILESGRPHIQKPFDLDEVSEILRP